MASALPQQSRMSRAELPPSADIEQSTSHPTSSTSTDPQAVVLNKSAENQTKAESPESVTHSEPRHCWICLQDEGVDSPETSVWRKPCPCNLEAHDECLLEWIADLEATNSDTINQKILCPQCKAEIKVVKPVDFVIVTTNLLSSIGRLLLDLSVPGAAVCCLFTGSLVYGANAVDFLFGTEQTALLLQPSDYNTENAFLKPLVKAVSLATPFLPLGVLHKNWRVFMGLPLIAPTLILSRSSLLDPAFITLPILYFGFVPKDQRMQEWPPTPGLSFAVLPYLRAAYKELYRYTFADLERKWDMAVQRKPREGETAEQIAQAQDDRLNNDGVVGGVLDINVEIVEVQDDEQNGAVNPQEVVAEQAPEPQIDGQAAAEPAPNQAPDQQRNNQPAAVAVANDQVWQFRREIPAGSLIRRSLAALCLPAAASLAGDLLHFSLPSRWVNNPGKGLPTGLLQEKWGRSLVGGCLFVVLKDALMLYYKWKRAKNHEKRRIVDYVKKDSSTA